MPSATDQLSYAQLVQRQQQLFDQMQAAVMQLAVMEIAGPGPVALSVAAHLGKRLRIGNGASTTTIEVDLPADAPVGTIFLPRQVGAGVLKFVAGGGSTLVPSNNRAGHNATACQNAGVSLTCERNDGGHAAVWLLDGETGVVA